MTYGNSLLKNFNVAGSACLRPMVGRFLRNRCGALGEHALPDWNGRGDPAHQDIQAFFTFCGRDIRVTRLFQQPQKSRGHPPSPRLEAGLRRTSRPRLQNALGNSNHED